MSIPIQATLLDVVQTVSRYANTDMEIVATVAYLINSGKVLLCGNFAGAKIDLSRQRTRSLSSPLPSGTQPQPYLYGRMPVGEQQHSSGLGRRKGSRKCTRETPLTPTVMA